MAFSPQPIVWLDRIYAFWERKTHIVKDEEQPWKEAAQVSHTQTHTHTHTHHPSKQLAFGGFCKTGVPSLRNLMADDLRWSWSNNRNKVHNKHNELDSSPNPPSSPMASTKRAPGAKKDGDHWCKGLYTCNLGGHPGRWCFQLSAESVDASEQDMREHYPQSLSIVWLIFSSHQLPGRRKGKWTEPETWLL